MFDERVPFGTGDVLWVESVEYPPSVGDSSGYEFWVTASPVRAPSAGFWLVNGWERAAGTQELVRLRTICVATEAPRARWRAQPPSPYRDAACGWAQPTQVLPIITRGERARRDVVGSKRPLLTRLAARRTAPIPSGTTAGGRHAAR
ncbi:MAG: hypothetical protein AUI14_07165 [Actinobacteria bacterium 13_2_20CM_2_71_6]|nr:MAG: hypothetical protein AUI14_07165 [Actinobacteria bacterium 13_2_20CM_2_71_6]